MENLIQKTLRTHPEYFDQGLIQKLEQTASRLDQVNQKNFSLLTRNKALQKANKELTKQLKEEKKDKKDKISAVKEAEAEHIKELERENSRLTSKTKDLQKKHEEDQNRILTLSQQNQALDQQNQLLDESRRDILEQTERKIDQVSHTNCKNSNLPPSKSEMSHAPKKEEKPSKSIRSRGGQPGHPAHRSRLWPKPDNVKKLRVKEAPKAAIRGIDDKGEEYFAVQEIDFGAFSLRVIETRYYVTENGCKVPKKVMEKYRINPVTYSKHYKAVILFLAAYATVPYYRLREVLIEVVGLDKASLIPSASTMSQWPKQFSEDFKPERKRIEEELLKQVLLHVDETSNKLNGKLIWIHVLTCTGLTLYFVTDKRGDWVNGPLALLVGFAGLLVCDHFACYQKLDVSICECMSHYARYLKKGVDFDHNPQCQLMLGILYGLLWIKRDCLEKGEEEMDPEILEEARKCLIAAASEALAEHELKEAERKKRLGDEAYTIYKATFVPTLKRFLEKPDDYLRWAYDFDVPFSNNLAELRLRATKAKKRASGQFRSMSGAQGYVDLLTCITNARDNHVSALEAIERILTK